MKVAARHLHLPLARGSTHSRRLAPRGVGIRSGEVMEDCKRRKDRGKHTMKKLASATLGIALGIASLVLCANLAMSHHSEAMFDPDKVVTVTGTVTEFQYVNPHVWLFVQARDEGVETLWAFETGSVSSLMRAGIKKTSLMPGDVVTVQAHPLRDGRPGGQWLTVTKSDGTALSLRPSAVPAAARPGN